MTTVKDETVKDKVKVPEFTKAQIVNSYKYVARRDALNALLEADKTYSTTEVDNILKKFDKGGK
ncbi:hypothetical protein [Lysinibacillus sphaericus]|uniref:hypothetical protein n=1 Tax=Lysinibacillus sphaericus TaxID=1421 RepID=UPI001910946F|nr:hypothetical protein [Lysinibacillus sphaericus]QPA56309.1 hypothetical protein INQ53_10110 [Lysinibacillus sphaericus]